MKLLSNKLNHTWLTVTLASSLLLLTSCTSSAPEEQAIAKCDYKSHMKVNKQTRDFIWRDQHHQAFSKNWRESSLVEISNRYQYLERKDLQDAINAQNEINWLQYKLTDLAIINNKLLNDITVQSCDNVQKTRSPAQLEEENAGIEYIQNGLIKILADIASKKAKIVAAIESKSS
jgi:hypothetical protein